MLKTMQGAGKYVQQEKLLHTAGRCVNCHNRFRKALGNIYKAQCLHPLWLSIVPVGIKLKDMVVKDQY